jgi:pyruvate dehydrogenase E2 component (dihydrolipoamide acetyltransferase)
VRRLARELGIDLARVQGSGLGGRITREDLTRHGKARITEGPATAASGPTSPPLPDFSQWGAVERSTMTGIRRITAERMANAWNTIPHVTHFEKADITQLEATRRKLAPRVAEKGGKLSMTAIALKIVASALKLFPNFNASLDIEHGEIVYKSYINLGLAVDTPRGLVVPVLRNVDQMNIAEIAVGLNEISAKARAGKISLKDLSGGTFTVSNLGGLGTHHFSPIVNWPEVAILGLGRATQEIAVVDGEAAPRLMLPISLSYDHRVIDGADAARFASWICEALENSFLLTLEG